MSFDELLYETFASFFMVLCRSVRAVLKQFVSYSPPGEGKGARLFFLVPAFWHLEVTRQGLGMVPLVHLRRSEMRTIHERVERCCLLDNGNISHSFL